MALRWEWAKPFPNYAPIGFPMITFESFLSVAQTPEIIFTITGSLITGAIIGAEREVQGKSAGLRTHMLVCFGAAIITLVALRQQFWMTDLAPDTQVVSDMTRMPHAVLTGIGFLGAGVIFRDGASVHGLTTAASLWISAALGIVYGVGEMELAVIGTLITFIVLTLLRLVQRFAPLPGRQMRIKIRADAAGFDDQKLAGLLSALGLEHGPISLTWDRDSQSVDLCTTSYLSADIAATEPLARQLRSHDAVHLFTIEPVLMP